MPEWKGVADSTRLIKCENRKEVTVNDMTPGEYDVSRLIENLRVGDEGRNKMCDRVFHVDITKVAKLEFVRNKGCSLSGQVLGLKEAGLPGAFVYVRPKSATGNPHAFTEGGEWRLTTFDAVTTGPDGQFQTARIAPGTYTVTAEAYAPRKDTETSWPVPTLLGKVKVAVPESGKVQPLRIEMDPVPEEEPTETLKPTLP
jgi:hypothetical protein